MFSSFLLRLLLVFCCTVACCKVQAQSAVEMKVETTEAAGRQNILDLVVALTNTSASSFNGTLHIKTPDGFKSISVSEISVKLKPEQHIFIPLKIIKGKSAAAGATDIVVDLVNDKKESVVKKSITQQVEVNNAMSLQAVTPTIFLTNTNDSLSVKVNVTNLGNQSQQVFVVFNIPELTGEESFFEQTAVIDVRKDSIFDFKFWVPKSLLDKSQFAVNVAAMRGAEKIVFGSLSVNVQNVSSVKRYEDINSLAYARYYQKNSLTASYRTSGNDTGVYQLIGSGDVDLPAGYLSVSGNIYKADSQNEPLISNTFLAYRLDNHQLKVGNISQQLELPMFGRGIQFDTSDKTQNNRLQAGFIDDNFNLTQKDAFLKRGYGFYALGTFGANNPSDQKSFNYVFKKDNMEQVGHNMVGFENVKQITKDWNLRLKAHGAISHYERFNKNQPSYALETQYNGLVKDIRLSGNYFVSSSYFPGNRRGVVQLQQNFMKNLKRERMVYANIFYSDFAPQSYTYSFNMKTTTFRLDAGITFPRLKSIGSSLGLQYYKETGNAFSWIVPNGFLSMEAFRVTENFNWLSKNQKHSVVLGIEEGLVQMSNNNKIYPQLKINSIYSYKGFNASATYQHGSYFLSEYSSLLVMDQNQNDFNRFMLSLSTDHKFIDNKLFVRSGAAYLNDFISGETPSAFLNLQYLPTDKYRFYLNSSWFHYSKATVFQNAGMFVVEAGITMNLGSRAASAGRKGTLSTFVYFDKNGNSIFDENDEPAPDFFITIDKTTFKSDANGQIKYKSLPFGTYKIQPVLQNGWFTEGTELVMSDYSQQIVVALHQNGSLKGKIQYRYDEKTVKNFDAKAGGIVFTVTKNGSFVQRIGTDDDGSFVAFLPTGTYEITLDSNSLSENTFCTNPKQQLVIESGKITHVVDFIIEVKQKQVKIKKFGS